MLIAASMIAVAAACPPFSDAEDMRIHQFDMNWVVVNTDGRSNINGLAGMDPAEVGAWDEPLNWPADSTHLTMLATGQVMQWGDNTANNSIASLWDPETGQFTTFPMNIAVFCCGHSNMPDGRVLVTGGRQDTYCTNGGIDDVHIYDPFSGSWSHVGNMEVARWYPTNLQMPDGRTFIFSGRGAVCELIDLCEVFDPTRPPGQQLSTFEPGNVTVSTLYPRMHVLTDGRIALVGATNQTRVLDPSNNAGWQSVDTSSVERDSGCSFLIPGREDEIMIVGGHLTTVTQTIDFKESNPQWSVASPINIGRRHADVVILPDKSVLLIGGGTEGLYDGDILTGELWDPDTEEWTILPDHQVGHMYHSTSQLLPDGRVVTSGETSGPPSEHTGEMWSPPYLFRGSRPTILDAPSEVQDGVTFEMQVGPAVSVESIVLIRLSSDTHSNNVNQRLCELSFTDLGGGSLEVEGPPSLGHAPPGHYYLFAVAADGAPSIAEIVRVTMGDGSDPPSDGCSNDDIAAADPGAGDKFGRVMTRLGDVDGDGCDDYAVAAPYDDDNGGNAGKVQIISGMNNAPIYTKRGRNPGDKFGWAVGMTGDVNADGFADFAIGAPWHDHDGLSNAGRIDIWSGADGSKIRTHLGESSGDRFGYSVCGAIDVDEDGYDDLIVGAPRNDDAGSDAGKVYVFSGQDGSIDRTLIGHNPGDEFGYSVVGFSRSDVDDYAVGSPRFDEDGNNRGLVEVFSGADGSLLFDLRGLDPGERFGSALARIGFSNGDSHDDLLVSAPLADKPGRTRVGRVEAFNGRNGNLLWLKKGQGEGDRLGSSLGGMVDVNGDGRHDVVIGAHRHDSGGNNAGRVYVRDGTTGAALLILDGESNGDQLGYSVALLGSDDESFRAVAAGVPHHDEEDANEGMVKVVCLETIAAATAGPMIDRPDGDLDGDGIVDNADIALLMASWGPCERDGRRCDADLDHDGAVGTTDLMRLLEWMD